MVSLGQFGELKLSCRHSAGCRACSYDDESAWKSLVNTADHSLRNADRRAKGVVSKKSFHRDDL